MIRLVGVDLSLTSTGVARLTLDESGEHDQPLSHTEVVGYALAKDATLQERAERVWRVAYGVLELTVPGSNTRNPPDLLAVEGPAYANDPGAGELHGLRWAVYRHWTRHAVPFVEVNPSTLKLYATGNGRAEKTLVVQAIRRHYGDRFDIPLRKVDGREDVADAIALVAMAARSIGRPIDEDHPTRLRAVRTPRWNNGEDT